MEVREPSAKYLARPAYKQTEVGVIPEDWEVETIGETMRLINGRAFRPDEWQQSGLPIIRIQNLNDTDSAFNYFAGPIEERHRIESGDLLFAWSGTTGTSFGARLWGGPTGVLNQHIFKVVPNLKKLSLSYAFLVLRKVQEQIEKQAHGFKASFVHVKKSDLVGVLLPVPPTKAEQQAIAEALSDADALIESLEQLLAKKRQIKQGAMQELLTGQKRLPGFAGEWEHMLIGDFTDCTAGGTPNTGMPEYWGGSIRWMNSGELNLKTVTEVEGRITEDGMRNSSTKLLPTNCVLIGLAGQGRTRGTVAMNVVPLCTNQSIAAILPNESFVPQYLYYNLDSRYDELRELSAGDGGRGGLNLTIIRSLSIPFPSIHEQTAIATLLSDMDAEIAALEAKLAKARSLKQGMMQELLTGRIRLV